jgi:ubiquinone/menaquinone biosynthesis C-methylase UbiE
MNGKIGDLLALADQFSTVVKPYPFRLDTTIRKEEKLEKETSDLYSGLWKEFEKATLTKESVILLKNRLPGSLVKNNIRNARVLDMGCGSGRYSIALAGLGAKEVTGVDYQEKAFLAAQEYCEKKSLPVTFREANVLALPFGDESFDFVLCNGVLHHTSSIEQGIRELYRVLKKDRKAFLYIYGNGGIFWTTRKVLRNVFGRIPLDYTKEILNIIGVPKNRFIFCDTWYVPVETHTKKKDLERMLTITGFTFEKVVSRNDFDVDYALEKGIPMAEVMWGEGDHRYILKK